MGYRSILIASSSRISVKDNKLVIDGETQGKIPMEDIRSVILENRSSQISSYALSVLSEMGVCVYFCDEKHLPSAVLLPLGRYTRQRRRILSQISQSKPKLKRMWQDIVVAKIVNQARCLELCGVDVEYYRKVFDLTKKVQSGDVTNVEGQAAALYFKFLFGKGFVRGEDNPINAALNYGYAILRGYIARVLAGCGFEPSLGIHHHSELNNYNLADDLIEPFRPLVDLFVFQNLTDDEFSIVAKRKLCNILNYELLSGGEHHSVAYSAERLIHSLERCLDTEYSEGMLLLPAIEMLKRHEYE